MDGQIDLTVWPGHGAHKREGASRAPQIQVGVPVGECAVRCVHGRYNSIFVDSGQNFDITAERARDLVPTLRVGMKIGALRHGTQSVRGRSHAERGNEDGEDCTAPTMCYNSFMAKFTRRQGRAAQQPDDPYRLSSGGRGAGRAANQAALPGLLARRRRAGR